MSKHIASLRSDYGVIETNEILIAFTPWGYKQEAQATIKQLKTTKETSNLPSATTVEAVLSAIRTEAINYERIRSTINFAAAKLHEVLEDCSAEILFKRFYLNRSNDLPRHVLWIQ